LPRGALKKLIKHHLPIVIAIGKSTMPHYRKHGKILRPITPERFVEVMETGHFTQNDHRGFVTLLYYSAVRKMEALGTKRKQITLDQTSLIYEVGERLKHSARTDPLFIPRDSPFVYEIEDCWEKTREGERIWQFSPKTAYNIMDRAFDGYPHYFRLSRITNFLLQGWTIPDIHSWTGLSVVAINSYLGQVSVQKMGASLR